MNSSQHNRVLLVEHSQEFDLLPDDGGGTDGVGDFMCSGLKLPVPDGLPP